MKKLILFLCGVFAYAQIGIGTDEVHPSASLEINAKTYLTAPEDSLRGVLFPRIALNALNDGISPVNNPVNGNLVFNRNINSEVRKGLYYWNSTYPKWDRGYLHEEIPKTVLLRYTGTETEYPILDSVNAGNRIPVGSPNCLYNMVFQENATAYGIELIETDSGNQRYFSLFEPGSYLLELNYTFKIPDGCPDDPTRCKIISTVNDVNYYYDGLFYDVYVMLNEPGTDTWYADIDLPLTFRGRMRKEDGVITPFGEEHIITQYYPISVPDDGLNRAIAIFIGRMTGSSINTTVNVIPEKSFVKINKY